MNLPSLLPSNMPNRNEIAERMAHKLSENFPVLNSVIYSCAEEAEKILLEIQTPELNQPKYVIVHQSMYNNARTSHNKYYDCSNCKISDIRAHYKYCPNCGSKIKWKL